MVKPVEEKTMQTCQDSHRFPDLHNLPKPHWRDAFKALVAPAQRIHNYRNLHRRMFHDAVRQLDCDEDR